MASTSYLIYSCKYDSEGHFAQSFKNDNVEQLQTYYFVCGSTVPDEAHGNPYKTLNMDPGKTYSSAVIQLTAANMSALVWEQYGANGDKLDDKTVISVVGESENWSSGERQIEDGGWFTIRNKT